MVKLFFVVVVVVVDVWKKTVALTVLFYTVTDFMLLTCESLGGRKASCL